MVQVHLMVFVECSWNVLLILKKWGWSDYWPRLNKIVYFGILSPLLGELQEWAGDDSDEYET